MKSKLLKKKKVFIHIIRSNVFSVFCYKKKWNRSLYKSHIGRICIITATIEIINKISIAQEREKIYLPVMYIMLTYIHFSRASKLRIRLCILLGTKPDLLASCCRRHRCQTSSLGLFVLSNWPPLIQPHCMGWDCFWWMHITRRLDLFFLTPPYSAPFQSKWTWSCNK